jgi:hypothetical protein
MHPDVHYPMYNSPPSVTILGQMDSVPVSHPTSRRSISILSYHLCLGLSSGLLHSDFPTKTLYAPLFWNIRSVCPANFSRLYHPTDIRWVVLNNKLLPIKFWKLMCNKPPASHRTGPSSITVQFVWDVWWIGVALRQDEFRLPVSTVSASHHITFHIH